MIVSTNYSKVIFPTLFEGLIGKKGYPPSILIVDGIVASGKSTFVDNFKSYLEELGYHASILRIDWFVTFQENRMPFHLIILALFFSMVFGMNSSIFTKHISTFVDIEKINSIISKINSFQNDPMGSKNLSIPIENQIRQVKETLSLKSNTFILIEGVFSSVLLNQLKNNQKLLISSKTSKARHLFFKRSKNSHFTWWRIFIQSIIQVPPGYMQIVSKRSSTFDYILDMKELTNPHMKLCPKQDDTN